MADPAPSRIALDLIGVTKIYPGAVALRDVDLSVAGGEVVGLVGENGAGKSTLLKVLGGAIAPDAGAIVIDGSRHARMTPSSATAQGIAFVHQELNPFDNLDVAGNVLLGREIRRGWPGRLDRAAMVRAVTPILKMLGTRFGAEDPVADLSLADRQMLEIARALSIRARLVILDEPTSSLTMAETRRLLAVIAQLRADGVAVLFVSHRLAEIEAVADRVMVLRDGRVSGALARDQISRDRLVRLMIGRDLARAEPRADPARGAPVLGISGLRTRANPNVRVDLTLHRGEILGLAGLVGAGRTELARAVFGIDPVKGGHVSVHGRTLPPGSVAAAIAAGLCLVPEDRKAQGLLLDFAIAANIALPNLTALSRAGVVDLAGETALAEDSRRQLSIRTPDVARAAAELSGGNQQKVVLAKWLARKPDVLLVDEPTRGIDVGARAEVYRLMRDLADRGVGILMISSDMEEVIGVSDRVAVMCRGRITGILDRDELSEEAILRLAVG